MTTFVPCPDGGKCGHPTHDPAKSELALCTAAAARRGNGSPSAGAVSVAPGSMDLSRDAFDYAAHGDTYTDSAQRQNALLRTLRYTDEGKTGDRLYQAGWRTPADADSGEQDVSNMDDLISEFAYSDAAVGDGGSHWKLANFLEAEGIYRAEESESGPYRVGPDNLNDLMEFEHPVQVFADGSVGEPSGVYAPELFNGELSGGDKWELLNGYSGQQGHSGPTMHQSETISGGLARDILAEPGTYVAVVATSTCAECIGSGEIEDDDDDEGGPCPVCNGDGTTGDSWAVARLIEEKPGPAPAEIPDRRGDRVDPGAVSSEVFAISRLRTSEMTKPVADAVHEAMVADGYLTTTTFSPFDDMSSNYQWLRESYVVSALDLIASREQDAPVEQAQPKRLNKKQLAKALAGYDQQIDEVNSELTTLANTYAARPVPAEIGERWNDLHDRERELREERARVEANPRPIPADEMGTWALVQQNID